MRQGLFIAAHSCGRRPAAAHAWPTNKYLGTSRGAVSHSIIVSLRVKMDDQALNIPDFTVLLQATPDSLKILCIIKITKAIIASDLTENCHIETITEHRTRDNLRINRLIVICPGDRFGVCTQWQNFHISCFVSRAFHLLCHKLLFDLDWASTTEIEEVRKIVEDRFKIRLLSVIDAVNSSRDNWLVCERYHRLDRIKEWIIQAAIPLKN